MVVSLLHRLFVPFWFGERQHCGGIDRLGGWRGTPATFNGGSTRGPTDGKVGRRGEGLYQVSDAAQTLKGRRYT